MRSRRASAASSWPRIAPRDAEPIVLKPRPTPAFDSTPLEILLGSLETERILLAGMATGKMCVTQTAIAGRELGYKITVLAGACACVDQRREQISLEYLGDVVGVHIER